MTYKSILVHVEDSKHATQRTIVAHELAKQFDSHLIGLAVTGISRYVFEGSDFSISDPNIGLHLNDLHKRAERAIERFNYDCNSLGGNQFEANIANDEANGGLGLRARYCDLIVIGQSNPHEPSPSVMSDFPEFMVVNAGRPTLIIPYAGAHTNISRRVVIAWDGSREAARAVTDSIPVLKKANSVQILILNPGANAEAHGDEPGADIALYLARHGIKVEVCVRFSKNDIGDAILQISKELDASLLVMGAYGHSRFREMVMGGVTRHILENMNLPVLMSH
ncbi:universal stress protein [Undibacterium sp. LX40W]|uniref:Universal stress protein n=1 Tax=Undibacterium nitidum TaxID=2762298 RepID=A0A923HN90_9BURK|nr:MULTISPECIES: universal stress protein [Undibacterium]MBC3880205.1 universal stress protein [Undibacterium nitidum]MBC3891059.1 universal stress protein [Undibacterium sp. LX40W]